MKKCILILCLILLSGVFFSFVLFTLKDNLEFYITPSQLNTIENKNQNLRIGGFIKDNSVTINGNKIHFILTDHEQEIKINYEGRKPNLFTEGKPIIVLGKFAENENIFIAKQIIATHDENYIKKY